MKVGATETFVYFLFEDWVLALCGTPLAYTREHARVKDRKRACIDVVAR